MENCWFTGPLRITSQAATLVSGMPFTTRPVVLTGTSPGPFGMKTALTSGVGPGDSLLTLMSPRKPSAFVSRALPLRGSIPNPFLPVPRPSPPPTMSARSIGLPASEWTSTRALVIPAVMSAFACT